MKEKKIKEKIVYQGKVFTAYEDTVELPDGNLATREVIEHHGGVCIYGQIGDDVLMVRQFRYALQKEFLEFPAGKLELNEDPQQAAARELEEETGYRPARIVSLGHFVPTCGYSSEIIYLFVAEDLVFVGQNLDPTEFLTIERVKVENLRKMVKSGEITDGKTLAMILKVGIYQENQ